LRRPTARVSGVQVGVRRVTFGELDERYEHHLHVHDTRVPSYKFRLLPGVEPAAWNDRLLIWQASARSS
jgi:hypothetical protein